MPRPTASSDVFRAVADPTRRAAIEVLARRPQLAVTDLAAAVGVSVPLLSRHLAVLREAGVVEEQRSGRRRLYNLRPEPLHELHDWASLFTDFWAERIHGLRGFLDRQHERPADQLANDDKPTDDK